MHWHLIPKHLRAAEPLPPGTYRNWKPLLAIECQRQCVYCALPDYRFGGEYNFHVEHFEPKSRAPQRINEWANLFYACAICNTFKGNDWPPPSGPAGYLNPSLVDFESVFERLPDGSVKGRNSNAAYMVERLYLNRPQLRLERREAALFEQYYAVRNELRALQRELESLRVDTAEANKLLLRLIETVTDIDTLIDRLRTVSPYAAKDVRRR